MNLAIRHTRECLRRPAADIGSLARGKPYMAGRRIAPTTALRASARGQRATSYRAAFGTCRSRARPMSPDHPEDTDASRPETPNHLEPQSPSPAGYRPATGTCAHQPTGATHPVTATTPPTDPQEHVRLTALAIARAIRPNFAHIRE